VGGLQGGRKRIPPSQSGKDECNCMKPRVLRIRIHHVRRGTLLETIHAGKFCPPPAVEEGEERMEMQLSGGKVSWTLREQGASKKITAWSDKENVRRPQKEGDFSADKKNGERGNLSQGWRFPSAYLKLGETAYRSTGDGHKVSSKVIRREKWLSNPKEKGEEQIHR